MLSKYIYNVCISTIQSQENEKLVVVALITDIRNWRAWNFLSSTKTNSTNLVRNGCV